MQICLYVSPSSATVLSLSSAQQQIDSVVAAFPARNLPPEVLLCIFWTMVPLPYESDPSVGSNSSWIRILRTKKALALVARGWHGPAMEVLYADIVLRRMDQITLLAESLRTSKQDYGRLIRSLRIDCRIFTEEGELKHVQDDLKLVFSRCRKLRSFSYRLGPQPLRGDDAIDNGSISSFLLHAPGLDQLHDLGLGMWEDSTSDRPLSSQRWHLLSQLATRLVSLKMGSNCLRTDVVPMPHARVNLPCLENLTLFTFSDTFTDYILGAWTMPNLTSLTAAHCLFFPTAFLAKHGRRLRYLQIFDTALVPGPGLDRGFDGPGLRCLATLCPVLEHLVLPCLPATPMIIEAESLRFLDVWTLPFHDDYSDIPESTYLAREQSSVPALRSVRLLLTEWQASNTAATTVECPTICHPELLAGRPDGVLRHRISDSWVVQTASVVAPASLSSIFLKDALDEHDAAV